jgi:hypothetical protein
LDGPSSISLETPEGMYPCHNPDFTLVKNICCCPVCGNLSQSHKELKEKVRNKKFLFAMTSFYMQIYKEPTKILELISDFSKDTECKVNMQKSTGFIHILHTRKSILEN